MQTIGYRNHLILYSIESRRFDVYFLFAFAVIAFQVVAETFRDDVQSMVLRIAVWPFQMIIPTAFLLTSIRHLIYTIKPDLRPEEGARLGENNMMLSALFLPIIIIVLFLLRQNLIVILGIATAYALGIW